MENNHELQFILYARKSQESEDRQVQSIPDQVHVIEQIALKAGYKVVQVITEAKSAKSPNQRPGFQEVLDVIEAGKANAILCWHLNRLSRNPQESGALQQLLQDGKIQRIHTDGRIYEPEDNALLFSVESSMANQYVRDLSKNTKRGLYSKFERGIFPCLAPLGYMNDKLTKTIVPDPERFDMVRKMWEMLLSGTYLPSEIHEMAMNDWGLTIRPTGKRGGRFVSKSSMYRIFNNEFYAGMLNYNGHRGPGAHQPMITLDEFDQAQDILGARGKPRHQKHESPYTGLVFCPDCGCSITMTVKHKLVKQTGRRETYSYFHCTRRKNTRDFKCNQARTTASEFEEQLASILKQIELPRELLDWVFSVIDESRADEDVAQRAIYENQIKEIAHKQQQIQSLIDMRSRDMISDAEFLQQKTNVKESLEQLQRAASTMEQQCDRLELVRETFNFASQANDSFLQGNAKTKRNIVRNLGTDFVLNDKILQFSMEPKLQPFLSAVPVIREQLELMNLPINKRKSEAFAPLIPIMGG